NHRSERMRAIKYRAMREQLQSKSMRRDSIGVEPWLWIDCLVHVAVLHPRGVELEMQVCAERPAGLADATDDLPGLHGLAGVHSHRGHVRGHRRHAVAMLDGNMVARPVTRVAGVEHDSRLHSANRRAVRGAEVKSGVIAGPAAVLAEAGTDDGSGDW